MPLDQTGYSMLAGEGVLGYDSTTDTLIINVSRIRVVGDLPEAAPGVNGERYDNGGAVYIDKSTSS